MFSNRYRLMELVSSRRDKAQSPVIGVILVVSITIILAAVLATFVLGFGEDVKEDGPGAAFDYTYSDKNNRVKVTMKSGNTLNGDLLRFGGAATEKTEFGAIHEWTGGSVTAGDTATVGVESDETLHLIWQENGSDQTAIVSTYEVPKDPAATASIGSVITTDTRTHPGGVCVDNVQFSNAWGGNVYVVAEDEEGTTSDAAFISTSGGSVKLNLNHNDVDNEQIEVTVYETKQENNELDTVTSEAKNNDACSV